MTSCYIDDVALMLRSESQGQHAGLHRQDCLVPTLFSTFISLVDNCEQRNRARLATFPPPVTMRT